MTAFPTGKKWKMTEATTVRLQRPVELLRPAPSVSCASPASPAIDLTDEPASTPTTSMEQFERARQEKTEEEHDRRRRGLLVELRQPEQNLPEASVSIVATTDIPRDVSEDLPAGQPNLPLLSERAPSKTDVDGEWEVEKILGRYFIGFVYDVNNIRCSRALICSENTYATCPISTCTSSGVGLNILCGGKGTGQTRTRGNPKRI